MPPRSLTHEQLLDSAAALRGAERFIRDFEDADRIELEDARTASGNQALILHVQPELARIRDGLRHLRESLGAEPPAAAREAIDDLARRVGALVRLIGWIVEEHPAGDRP